MPGRVPNALYGRSHLYLTRSHGNGLSDSFTDENKLDSQRLVSVSTKPGSSCRATWLSSAQPALHRRITREDWEVLSDQASLLKNPGLIRQK